MSNVTRIADRLRAAPSDATLVLAARKGEPWAQEALFRRHAAMADGLAFRLLGRDPDVADVVQDAYAIALGSLHKIDDPQAFASFLASIVVNVVRRLIRRRRFARRLGLVPAPEPIDVSRFVAPDAPADVVVELERIYRLLDDLPADERIALVLRRVEGLPLDDVAARCGCSLATVKRRIAAAEDRLTDASASARAPIELARRAR